MNYSLSQLRTMLPQDLGNIRFSEPLKNHCTWRIGGPADALIEPESIQQLAELRLFLYEKNIPSIIIGQGSNLLFDDKGVRGVVIKISNKLSGIEINGQEVTVEAGM